MEGQVVCVENIGPREVRKRLIFGALFLLLALAGAVALVLGGASRLWRLGLWLPLWGAALGYYQARERTCVVLARKSARNLDRGIEVVTDPVVVAASRRMAARVQILAAVTATVATLLLVFVPAP
jgi:hypothetical protein